MRTCECLSFSSNRSITNFKNDCQLHWAFCVEMNVYVAHSSESNVSPEKQGFIRCLELLNDTSTKEIMDVNQADRLVFIDNKDAGDLAFVQNA